MTNSLLIRSACSSAMMAHHGPSCSLRSISILASNHRLAPIHHFPSSSKSNGTPTYYSSIRHLSTKDIFLRDLPAELAKLIPSPPVPIPKPTLEEMISSGQSLLDELELWSWWKPSSWLRLGMEYVHLSLDLPWWATIIGSTILLRLVLFPLPIAMQKLNAKQNKYSAELREFQERTQKAQREGNNALAMQVLWEQRDFMKKKGINVFAIFPLMACNWAVFMTQFCALKKFSFVKYPGFESQGLFWFKDLTVGDPYWALPGISAVTLHLVMRCGLEAGSMATQGIYMRYALLWGLPVVVFFGGNYFSSAVCLYWVTSNLITLLFSYLFRVPRVRALLKIPPRIQTDESVPSLRPSVIKSEWKKVRSASKAPTLETLKEKDLEQFKKAGLGKPVLLEKRKGTEK